jgi:hypothetical protein
MEGHDVHRVADEFEVPNGASFGAANRSGTAVAEPVSDTGCACGRPGGTCVCGAEAVPTPNIEPPPAVTAPPSTDPAPASAPPVQFVYALGRISPRFPTVAIEKEFRQVVGRAETAGQTDSAAFQAVLSERDNRYLLRSMCWVLSVEGVDTYVLVPRDPADFDLLAESLGSGPDSPDIDAVIGTLGPLAPAEACAGLVVPMVVFDQIYSFDRDGLVKAIPRPKEIAAKEFGAAAEEVLERIMQLADNAGARDEHRALNYLALRYPAIYATAADSYGRSFSLSGVEVVPSRLAGARNIVDVIFSYTHRQTDVSEKYFVRVDVTEEFPFLVTRLATYYDR